jgi:hypothetical protein
MIMFSTFFVPLITACELTVLLCCGQCNTKCVEMSRNIFSPSDLYINEYLLFQYLLSLIKFLKIYYKFLFAGCLLSGKFKLLCMLCVIDLVLKFCLLVVLFIVHAAAHHLALALF